MTGQNIELARRATRDLRSMFEVFDEEIVWDNRGTNAPADLAGAFRGKREVIRTVESWVGTWLEYDFAVEELIEAGDLVLLGAWERGRGKGSGVALERRWGMVWTFRDARVVLAEAYDSLAQACAAHGVTPPQSKQ